MNREIKFRALDQKGNWQYGTYYYGCMYPTSFNGHYVNDINIDENTLGQFTGLKDKNGVDIYEGDICRLFSCDRDIQFHEGSFGYFTELNENASFIHISNHHFKWKDNKSYKIEVIGNIYQTPELINN